MNVMGDESFGILLAFGIFVALAVGFVVLDRWHQRKAWRDADREARAWFKQKYGRDYPG